MAVGQFHVCMRTDDEITCWGNALTKGVTQPPTILGDNADHSYHGDSWNYKYNNGPETLPTFNDETLTHVEQIRAGAEHTCGIFKDVELQHKTVCWGKNDLQQVSVVREQDKLEFDDNVEFKAKYKSFKDGGMVRIKSMVSFDGQDGDDKENGQVMGIVKFRKTMLDQFREKRWYIRNFCIGVCLSQVS